MTLGAPVAYISSDREVMVVDRTGTTHSHTLHLDGPLMWGTWQLGTPKAAAFSWPTWSPDGRYLACFRLPSPETASARVFAHEVGGVSSFELADLDNRLPIYLHWGPDSRQVAVLSQRRDRLQLSSTSLDSIGQELTLAEGSPLFFTWAGRRKVAAFIGDLGGQGSRMALLDPTGRQPSSSLPGEPGNFCAPLWLDPKVVYVLHERGHTLVVSADIHEREPTRIEEVTGLVALVASPDGKTMARALAPDGDGTPYRNIALVDVETNEVREVADMPCLAYLWSPHGDKLVIARVNTERNLLEWLRMDLDGQVEHLCDMYPTRDLGFYLRFFEQYCQSHPLIDPAGKSLLLAGTRVPNGSDEDPRIWQVSLDTGEISDLADGLFAVYGPETAPL
jgi:Tol biopolymer transport system component